MNPPVLLLTMALIMSFACRPTYIRKGSKEIKNEQKKLKIEQIGFKYAEIDKTKPLILSYDEKTSLIKSFFDNKSDEVNNIIDDFDKCKKNIFANINQYSEMQKKFNYAHNQLYDLKHDLKIKSISKESFLVYLNQEKESNSKLATRSRLVKKNLMNELNNFDVLEPKIDSLFLKLNE